MAKKQNRSKKNVAGQRHDIPLLPEGQSADFTSPFTNLQFGTTIAILMGMAIYLVGFLFLETEIGDRFGAYLALLLNPDFYMSFWTGSPTSKVHLADRLPIVAGFAFHIFIAVGTGRLIGLFLLPEIGFNRFERIFLELAIGLTTISTYTLLVGLCWLYGWGHWLILPLLICSLFGIFWRRKDSRGDSSHPGTVTEKSVAADRHWSSWIWILSIPFCLFIFLGSMIPPWEFDVREYHLQIPKEWFRAGGVEFVPHNVYGNMPLGTEMHALFAMLYSFGPDNWWWGALIGKTISGSFAIFNCFLVYFIGRRLFGNFSGAGASLLYVSTPWISANSIIGYNESAVAFYLLTTTLVLVANLRSECPFGSWKPWLLMGLFCGSAVAAKYTAVPFVCIPLIAIAGFCSFKKTNAIKSTYTVAIVGLGIALTASPWLIKNWAMTGNPTYPLAASIFGSPKSEAQIEQWDKAHSSNTIVPGGDELFSKVSSLFIKYKWLSPLTIPFFLIAFLGRNRQTCWWILGYLFLVFGVWFFFTHRLERFLLPFYPIVCLVGGAGVAWLYHAKWRNMATTILIVGSLMNGLFSTCRLVGDVRIFASLKRLDSRYLDAEDYFHPEGIIVPLNHLSREIAWLNRNRPEAKVLFYGECRPFTAEFEVVYNTCFDSCKTWQIFGQGSAKTIHKRLVEQKITHLLINPSELERLKSTYGYNVDHKDSFVEIEDILKWEGQCLRRITFFGNEFGPINRNEILLEVIDPEASK